jgi:hypothetical protein
MIRCHPEQSEGFAVRVLNVALASMLAQGYRAAQSPYCVFSLLGVGALAPTKVLGYRWASAPEDSEFVLAQNSSQKYLKF